jgi:hypothetical protein
MAKASSIYRRLTGRNRALFGYTQLWLAPSHILLVKSARFTEQYQRFSLTDIQAIVITNLPDRTALQTAAAVAAILWMLGYFAVSLVFAKWFFAVTGGFPICRYPVLRPRAINRPRFRNLRDTCRKRFSVSSW